MTEIATAEHEIEVLPPAQPMQSGSLVQLREHAEAMDTAYKLADAMCSTALVPAIYRGKPQDGTAAILYGAELGLNPIQSLQQIFVVHGTPSIYSRTMVALLKRKGYKIWTEASTDDAVTVIGESPDGTAESSTWTLARAEKAGYVPTIDPKTGNFALNSNSKLIGNEKYLKDPQAMLYAKAAAEVCRKLAPDVLLGIAFSREEMELEDHPQQRVHSERARGVAALTTRVSAAPTAVSVTAEPAPADEQAATASDNGMTPTARKKWEKAMFAALGDGECSDRDDQLIVITALAGRSFDEIPEHCDGIDDDELRHVVQTLADWKKEGRLGSAITEVINSYVEFEAASIDGNADDDAATESTE
jgi:hypothetical protein